MFFYFVIEFARLFGG